MTAPYEVGSCVKFISEDESDLTKNTNYLVAKIDEEDNTCSLIDNVGDPYWVGWDKIEKVQNKADSETEVCTFKVSLQGGNIQSSYETTLNLRPEEASSLFVDLLQALQ